jgi:hypothetical protein
MIEREKQSGSNTAELLAHRRMEWLFEEMPIGVQHVNWPTGTWQRSETFLRVSMIPIENKTFSLDGIAEQNFRHLVRKNYLRMQPSFGDSSVGSDADNRNADFYEHRWYHKKLDYESRWRITSSMDVAHATQIREDEQWSLMDVVSYVVLLLIVGARWWRSLGYYGDGILFAELSISNLRLQQGRQGEFSGLFNPGGGSFGIGGDAVLVSANQRSEAKANVRVNFSTRGEDIAHTVTILMNGLLRSLGHAVHVAEFEKTLRIIFR